MDSIELIAIILKKCYNFFLLEFDVEPNANFIFDLSLFF